MAIYRMIFRNVTEDKQHWIFQSGATRYASFLPAKSEFHTTPVNFGRNNCVNLLVNGGLYGTSVRFCASQDLWRLWPETGDFVLHVEKRDVIVECRLKQEFSVFPNVESLNRFYEAVNAPKGGI